MFSGKESEDNSEIKKQLFLKKNFYESPFPNQYLCKECNQAILLIGDQSYQKMKNHIYQVHEQKLDFQQPNPNSKIAYYYEKLKYARPPPQYLSKYDDMKLLNDQWFDKLTTDGYPITVIIDSIMSRLCYKHERQKFFMEAEKSAAHLTECKQNIINCLQNLPLDLLPGQALWILRDKFKISPEAAKLLVQKYYYPYQEQNLLLKFLEKKNVHSRKYKSKDGNTIVVFSNPRMRSNYLLYGDCVTLSFYFVPLKRDKTSRHHNILLYVGQDKNLNPVIFAIGITNGESAFYYKRGIQLFLQIMDHLCPQTFIVNGYQIMQNVIEQLKEEFGYKFNFKVNWKYAKQVLSNYFEATAEIGTAMNLFSSIFAVYSESEYDMIFKFIDNGNLMAYDKLKQFEKKSYKFCLSKGSSSFVGFCMEEQFIEYLKNQVSTAFPFHKLRGFFYVLAFRFESTFQQRRIQANNFKNIYSINKYKGTLNKQFQSLAAKLHPQIFRKMLNSLERSIVNIKVKQRKQNSFVLIDDYLKNGQTSPLSIQVKYHTILNLWVCDCKQIYCTGLPCSHLIAVISRTNGSISYYINSRWLIVYNMEDLPAPEQFIEQQQSSIEYQDNEDISCMIHEVKMKCERDLSYGDNIISIDDSESQDNLGLDYNNGDNKWVKVKDEKLINKEEKSLCVHQIQSQEAN